MNFDIYCDESGLEALNNKSAHDFMAIGSVWMPSESTEVFKSAIKEIKKKYNIHGELKWNKLSPAYFSLYKEVIDYFFNEPLLRARIIIVETNKIDNIHYNNSDSELGFYKFYYQLLHHWILDFNNYNIFVDLKVNRDKRRIKTLAEVLKCANLSSKINQVQALPSDESLGIQLADLLCGLVAAKYNKGSKSEAKIALLRYIETKYLLKEIAHTPKLEEKLNIFKINLQGGW